MASRILVVLSVLLLATFMLAQGQYGSSTSQQSGQSASQQSGQSQSGTATSSPTDTSIEGCLQASGGNYTLTDKTSGKTYQLQGDTSKFTAHSGHEVRLTGTTSESSSASGMTSSAGSSNQPVFVVNNLKHISATCTTSNK